MLKYIAKQVMWSEHIISNIMSPDDNISKMCQKETCRYQHPYSEPTMQLVLSFVLLLCLTLKSSFAYLRQ